MTMTMTERKYLRRLQDQIIKHFPLDKYAHVHICPWEDAPTVGDLVDTLYPQYKDDMVHILRDVKQARRGWLH